MFVRSVIKPSFCATSLATRGVNKVNSFEKFNTMLNKLRVGPVHPPSRGLKRRSQPHHAYNLIVTNHTYLCEVLLVLTNIFSFKPQDSMYVMRFHLRYNGLLPLLLNIGRQLLFAKVGGTVRLLSNGLEAQ